MWMKLPPKRWRNIGEVRRFEIFAVCFIIISTEEIGIVTGGFNVYIHTII
jgi:uncharacterized DUF497 family protein